MRPSDFPYENLDPSQVWRQAVARTESREIDPHSEPRFRFSRSSRVASAGSCFAQRIAQALQENGFNYYTVENGPPFLSADQRREYNYGAYSARYGNIYTTLQLLQLAERAFGTFAPADDIWDARAGGFVDALRPRIQPPFRTIAELAADRNAHLAAVRTLFETLDIFIFTLGLTETWCSRLDDAAYPVCPGKDVGTFDPDRYAFRNLSIMENVEYFDRFMSILDDVNPRARVLLTVSPVPLVATAENRHVLQSTTYSKSVLRVLADEARRSHENVDYVASYEIITGTFNNADYFADDRRSMTDAGVSHVMRSFFKHFTDTSLQTETAQQTEGPEAAPLPDPCDEDVLAAQIARDFRT